MGECLKCRGKLRGADCLGGLAGPGRADYVAWQIKCWGEAGPGGMGGRAAGGAWAAAGPGGGRGATHSPYTVAHGGNCTNRATTRRKTAPNAAKPPPARAAGTTRTRGHDKNRTARPRCLGAAATTAATPAESSRAQPRRRRAFRGPSLRCPDAPSHGPTTRLVERVPPLGDNTSG